MFLESGMECLACRSTQLQRNGHRNKVQCYKCKSCGRQFLESYKQMRYSEEIKQLCVRMYLKGASTRAIEKLTDIHHTTILSWIREWNADGLISDGLISLENELGTEDFRSHTQAQEECYENERRGR